ncbi:nucleotide-binding alpha-beta plait domain-containing protein [Tanacetum coccineum]
MNGISKDVEETTISLPLKEALSGRPLFTLREGAHYRFKLAFTVLHNIVSGLTCTNTVWNGGIQKAYQHFLLGYFNIDSDAAPYILCHSIFVPKGNLKGHTGSFSQRMSRLWVPVLKANGCYIDAYVPAMKMFREILKEHTLKRSHQETSFLVNVEICHCLLGLGFMPYIFYVKAGEGEPSRKSVNFRTLLASTGNRADVAISLESVRVVHKRLINNVYGFSSSGKRNSNPFDALNTLEKDDELGTNERNSKLVENGVNSYMVSCVHETSYEAFGSPNTTHLKTRINDLKRQMLDKKLMLVDDDGKPLKSLLLFGHVLDECLKKIISDVLKNLKNPRRVVRGVQIGPNLGSKVQFNLIKKVYQLVSKENVENDDKLGTNEGKLVEKWVNSYVVSLFTRLHMSFVLLDKLGMYFFKFLIKVIRSQGHRSNNYSESKRNDHLDNNRRQEQRNKGIPNKSHPNFREEHKSFSSIFVSNIPWNASVQDLWDICNKWGVVIDVYIAAKRSKSGHRFGFVRFINVNDINQLVSNLRTAWMGGFHLFADVAKYGRTYNRPVERSGDGKPSVGSNSQSVSINENVFQSFNSYAKAVLGNKSVDMSGKYGTSNAGAESVGVSDCNKVYKEAGNEAVMSISVDDCIDLDGMERSILAKVKDLSVISELLKHMSSEGFDDVGLRYVGGRWVWLEFDSMDQVESVKTSKALKEIFLEFKDVSHDFIPDERCVWIDLVGLPLASWAPEVYKKLGGRWGSSVFTDMVNSESKPSGKKDANGPSFGMKVFENDEHLDVDSCDSESPKNVNNDRVAL